MTTTTRTIVREHEAELLVQNAEVVAEDVVALTLVSPAGETLPSWSPGAHIDLMLADDLVRQYSLCSSPGGRRRLAHRSPAHPGQPRGVAAGARHPDRGRHRDTSGGRATTSRWWPHRRYLFIAGGIGITPMLPMIAQAEAAGADWRLLYGGRHRASMAFLPELAALRRPGHRRPAGRGRLPRPRRRAGHTADGNAGLLLRPRGAALRGGGQVRGLAFGQPAPGAVLGQAAGDVRRLPTRASSWSCSRPASPSRCRRTRASSRRHSRPAPTSSAPAWRASAAPARPRSSRATSTTATPYSTRRSGPANEFMMICVSRCHSERLVLDI